MKYLIRTIFIILIFGVIVFFPKKNIEANSVFSDFITTKNSPGFFIARFVADQNLKKNNFFSFQNSIFLFSAESKNINKNLFETLSKKTKKIKVVSQKSLEKIVFPEETLIFIFGEFNSIPTHGILVKNNPFIFIKENGFFLFKKVRLGGNISNLFGIHDIKVLENFDFGFVGKFEQKIPTILEIENEDFEIPFNDKKKSLTPITHFLPEIWEAESKNNFSTKKNKKTIFLDSFVFTGILVFLGILFLYFSFRQQKAQIKPQKDSSKNPPHNPPFSVE